MLTVYLNSIPATKFILIEDCLRHLGNDILTFVIKNNIFQKVSPKIHVFLFENKPSKFLSLFDNTDLFVIHDYFTDQKDWITDDPKNFEQEISCITDNCTIIIDSLAYVVLELGLSNTYRLINTLISQQNILQLATVLHTDLCVDKVNTVNQLDNLATLILNLPPPVSKTPRFTFVYKKLGGKIIKLHEEYKWEDWQLVSGPIKKPDVTKMNQQYMSTILPEKLTTFKIDLETKEKLSRDLLELPYLQKDGTGCITYEMDEFDDWDEEDPDDDLDI